MRFGLQLQGWYYVLSGVWPVITPRTFQMVTGRKRDMWVVKTVGLQLAVIGMVLLRGAKREQPPVEVQLLAAGSAGVLAAVDVIYVSNQTIRSVYLFDALAELALLVSVISGRMSRQP